MTTTALAVFPTKVDRWLAVVLGVGLVVQVVGAFAALSHAPGRPYAASIALAGLLAPILIVGLFALPTRYELHADQLVVRSGMLRYRIPYADLREVHPTRNPLSAPAWSLDRLKLVRTRGYMLISPRDKPAFLRALQERTPQLKLDGDRLIAA